MEFVCFVFVVVLFEVGDSTQSNIMSAAYVTAIFPLP
jgi:hypothetical protein